MKTLLLQHTYPNHGYLPLLAECFVRNAEYCASHDMDYSIACGEMHDINLGAWDKVFHVKNALDSYDLVIWLDVDAMIYDLSRDIRDVPNPADTIGVVRFLLPTPHFNVGVMYFRSGKNVKDFVDKWCEKFPGQGAWHEQEAFNVMCDKTVFPLPSEWNKNYANNPSVNPLVMGFHGFGNAENRLKLMRNVLTAQEARRKV